MAMGAPLMISSVPKYARRTAKPPGPVTITNHRDGVLADGSIVSGTEQATDLSVLTQRSEEVAGYQLQPRCLGWTRVTSRSDEHGFGAALRSDFGTARQEVGSTLHDGRGEKQIDLMRLRHFRDVEFVRIRDGQGTQHDGIDQRKNGATRPDAERQRDHGDGGKSTPSGEQAGSETEVVQEMFEGSQGAHVATGLLHVIHAPHVAPSSPPCLSRVIATGDGEFLHLFEMKPQFLVEFLVDSVAPQQRPKRHQHALKQALVHAHHAVSRSVVTADDKRRHWVDFALELASTRTRQRVVLGPTPGGCLAPFREDPALVLQAVKRWIKRARTHLEHVARDLLDPKRDAPAVHRLERECLQDEEIERAL